MPRYYGYSESADLAHTKSVEERRQLQGVRDPRSGSLTRKAALYIDELSTGLFAVGRDGESKPLGVFESRPEAEAFLARQARQEDTNPSQGGQPGARPGKSFPTGTMPNQYGSGQPRARLGDRTPPREDSVAVPYTPVRPAQGQSPEALRRPVSASEPADWDREGTDAGFGTPQGRPGSRRRGWPR